MSPSELRTLLLDLGYVIHERKSTAYECVLEHEDERWVGTGTNPVDAFIAALASALPSRLGRHLAGIAEPSAPGEATSDDGATAEPIVTAATGHSANAVEDAGTPEHDERSRHPAAASSTSEPATSPVPAPALPPAADTLRAIRAISREIADDQTELGLCTARRQRLAITRWIAAARDLQRQHPDDDTIEEAVRSIAGRLTRLSKRWWPGRVTALALAATPAICATELGLGSNLDSWRDVADRAESALAQVEADDERAGSDEYGWFDARDCDPPPEAPDAALVDVVRDVEACGGSLAGEAPSDALPHADEIAHWARMLRWLRPHVDDADRWAAAVGRCRFWVAMRRTEFSVAESILDPAHRPPMAWARMLAPKATAVRVEPSELPPLPSDGDDLPAWIATVLADPLTDHDEIVERLRPHADAVLAMDSDTLAAGDRAVRRRLSKVKKKLGEPPTAVAARGETARAANDAEQRVTQPSVDPIRAAVIARVRGKRALVVTNRDDDDLGHRLVEEFGFSEADVRRSDPRRLDAAIDAVALGRFDIVLGVTGFVGHSTDGALKVACDRAGVPYVRVAKGRSGACLRALAREFGIGREMDAA